jgi:hypothetical protein
LVGALTGGFGAGAATSLTPYKMIRAAQNLPWVFIIKLSFSAPLRQKALAVIPDWFHSIFLPSL